MFLRQFRTSFPILFGRDNSRRWAAGWGRAPGHARPGSPRTTGSRAASDWYGLPRIALHHEGDGDEQQRRHGSPRPLEAHGRSRHWHDAKDRGLTPAILASRAGKGGHPGRPRGRAGSRLRPGPRLSGPSRVPDPSGDPSMIGLATARPVVRGGVDAPPSLGLHRAVWRWHFYAGLLVIPFMLLLAVTGGIYLFHDEIDAVLHSSILIAAETAVPAVAAYALVF